MQAQPSHQEATTKVFEHTPRLHHEPSWTPRGGLNRDMGLLPSNSWWTWIRPTPCLAQLMVQAQLASSLMGCISLLHLLGQPARNMPRRTLGRTRSRPRATCMHGRASYRPPGHRPSSKSKITCSTLFFMLVATLLRSGAKTGRSATHEHNRPGAAASLRGPRPSSTAASAVTRPRVRSQRSSRRP